MTQHALLRASATLALVLPALSGQAFAGPASAYPSYTPDLTPPAAALGECYARVQVPAQYETLTETIVTREAHTKMHVAQPELRTTQKQVMTKEASVRFAVRQPTYSSVSEQVLTRPSYDKLSVTKPTFQTVTETLQTSAPRLVWKKGNPGALARQGYVIHSTADGGYRGQGYSSTQDYGARQLGLGGEQCGEMCEIWCLVEEPGASTTVTRKVMASPGTVRRTRMPAVYQTVIKQVVSDPGGVQEIPVPAEYRSMRVEEIVTPGREALIEVPAEYGTIEKKQLISDERYEWRRVLCKPGTQGYSAPPASYTQPNYVQPSYSQPSYTAPAPTDSAPAYSAPKTNYYPTDSVGQYESGQVCRDENCPDSYPDSYQGSYPQAYSGGYSSDSAYESGRHFRKRARR